MLLGREVSAAMVLALPDPDEVGRTLLAVGSGCRARSSRLLEARAGRPVQAIVDAHDRIWALSQSQPTVDARTPLMLTVADPTP